ncbi:MAG: hypothetical protein ABI867_16935 [Kofleriaceae bacterium]
MTDLAPFRESPRFLLCPRCGEMLDRAFDAVLVCLRCEGVWAANLSIEKAFGDRAWPHGKNTWWRSAVNCPECAADGAENLMDAQMVETVIIDRCRAHGLWLDRGELGRLLGGTRDDQGNADLAILRERLKVVESDYQQLLARRESWHADVDSRRRSAADYAGWLEAEQRKRREAEEVEAAVAQSERIRGEIATSRERHRLLAEAKVEEERATRARLTLELEAAAKKAREEAERQAERARTALRLEHDKAIQKLGDARVQASGYVRRIESQIVETRDKLRASEAELEAARMRLRAVEDQLGALEQQKVP